MVKRHEELFHPRGYIQRAANKHMKRLLTLLYIQEIQMKIPMRYYHTPERLR